MTDYDDLIQQLLRGIDPNRVDYGWQTDCLAAADAIRELVDELNIANKQLFDADHCNAVLLKRAEKAEAECQSVTTKEEMMRIEIHDNLIREITGASPDTPSERLGYAVKEFLYGRPDGIEDRERMFGKILIDFLTERDAAKKETDQ